MMIKVYTIGFSNKSAQRFFELLKENGVRKIIDIRINNASQLSGFAKSKDLKYFARELADISYIHRVDLAPTKDLLKRYRDKKITWEEYGREYLDLLKSRAIDQSVHVEELDHSCLLCSENSEEHCHRRLLAEYLKEQFSDIQVYHLK